MEYWFWYGIEYFVMKLECVLVGQVMDWMDVINGKFNLILDKNNSICEQNKFNVWNLKVRKSSTLGLNCPMGRNIKIW